MARTDASDKQQESELEHVAGDVYSSEKREDIWAIIIAAIIFLLSVAFPGPIYQFFNKMLYVF